MLNEGFDVHVENACGDTGCGVDTQDDLDKVLAALAPNNKG